MRPSANRICIAIALAACLAAPGCGPHATAAPSAPAGSSTASRTAAPATPTAEATASLAPTATAEPTASASTTRNTMPLEAPIAQLPQPKPLGHFAGTRDAGVPVLMYHVIGTAPAGAAHSDLYVTPSEFVAQMRWLLKNGYHAVTLQQVYDYWHNGADLPSKPVVISFDDGDMPDFTIVAPLLAEVHWPGTLNLIVLGGKHLRFRPSIVRALLAAGWEIDSHTMKHTDVPGLSAKKLAYEVTGSRKRLQKLYGIPVNFFCYPSGRYDAAGIAAVQAAGYLGATTTLEGLARPGNPFLMKRVRVAGGTSPAGLAAIIGDAR